MINRFRMFVLIWCLICLIAMVVVWAEWMPHEELTIALWWIIEFFLGVQVTASVGQLFMLGWAKKELGNV